jgi:hypothetical protein
MFPAYNESKENNKKTTLFPSSENDSLNAIEKDNVSKKHSYSSFKISTDTKIVEDKPSSIILTDDYKTVEIDDEDLSKKSQKKKKKKDDKKREKEHIKKQKRKKKKKTKKESCNFFF